MPIPEAWKRAGSDRIFEGQSGTLIVWSNLDRVQWRKGKTLIVNTSREVGRIHRHNINIDKTRIRAASFCENRPDEVTFETTLVANDPLYLMTPSSTPKPWDNEAMFKQWTEKYYQTTVDGREATITVRYSIVKPDALKTDTAQQNPGSTDRGRHARHNIGVSVVRESREIVLEDAFLREGGSAENPQNRWWGCEVHFRRNCDELFGVDHNKQMASYFTQAAKTLAQDDRPNQLILDEMEIDEDDIIHTIVGHIRDETRSMMREIQKMFAQKRSEKKPDGQVMPEKKAAKTATDADRDAMKEGSEKLTNTDLDREKIPSKERVAGLKEQFVAYGQADQDAQQLAEELVREKLFYQFNSVQLDGFQMLSVSSNAGILHINLNMDHAIYDLLKHVESCLDENIKENHPAFQASVAVRVLLLSWARMEDQTESKQERKLIQDIEMRWGHHVEQVINRLREKDG